MALIVMARVAQVSASCRVRPDHAVLGRGVCGATPGSDEAGLEVVREKPVRHQVEGGELHGASAVCVIMARAAVGPVGASCRETRWA